MVQRAAAGARSTQPRPAESLVAIHLLSGRHWTPITGGVCIKKEGLSNRHGVPGVPGEEIWSRGRKKGCWSDGVMEYWRGELTFEGENYYCGGRGSEASKPTGDPNRCCARAEMDGACKRASQVREEHDNLTLMGDPFITTSRPEGISIIGGGFSGVMTAVNLARFSRQPLHVTIINQHRPAARGMAYGTRRMEHLLNVAARNMSAFPDLPDHFLQWLRTRSEYDTAPDIELRERFIPRMIYGDYLRCLMQQHLQSPIESVPVRTTFIEGEAVDVEPRAKGAVIHLSDGGRVEAGRIVLATGNEPPSGLPGCAELQNHPAWVGHPWEPWENRLPATGGAILLLGTGLT